MTTKDKFSFIIKKEKKKIKDPSETQNNIELNDAQCSKANKYDHMRKNNDNESNNNQQYSVKEEMDKPFIKKFHLSKLDEKSDSRRQENYTKSRLSNTNSADKDQQMVYSNISDYSDNNSVQSQPIQFESSNVVALKKNNSKDNDNNVSLDNNKQQYSNETFSNKLKYKNQSQKELQNKSSSNKIKGLKAQSVSNQNFVDEQSQTSIKSSKNLTETNVEETFEISTNRNIESFLTFIINLHSIEQKLKSKEKELQSCIEENEKLLYQQNQAIEANNFSKADSIETNIKQISATKVSIKNSINLLTRDIITTKKEEFVLKKQYANELDSISSNYTQLKQIIESNMESFINNEIAENNKDGNRLNKLKEKLYFIKDNIGAEENFIKEEEQKITEIIRSQASDIFDELEQFNQIKETLIDEIDELRKQLEMKEAELEKVNFNIQIKEKDINDIKANYSQEFSRINIKKRNFKENLKDYEEQEQNYQLKKRNHENLDIEYNNELNTMKSKIDDYHNIIQSLNENKTKQNEEIGLKEQLVNEENGLFNEISRIVCEIENRQKIIKEQSSDIQQSRVDIKVFESQIKQIDIRIPPLDEEKKTFVKMKNFKEAGRVSNQFKRLNEQKNNHYKSIEENTTKINKTEKYIKELTNEINVLLSRKDLKETDLKKVRYDYMINLINTITEYKRKGLNHSDIDAIINFAQTEIELLLNQTKEINQNGVNGQDEDIQSKKPNEMQVSHYIKQEHSK